MKTVSESSIELAIACRVLGVAIEQSLALCSVLGVKPLRRGDDVYIARRDLDVLYRRLYPEFVASDPSTAEWIAAERGAQTERVPASKRAAPPERVAA